MRQTISRDAIKDTCSFDWRFVDEFSHSYINRPYAKPSVKSAGVFVSLEDDMSDVTALKAIRRMDETDFLNLYHSNEAADTENKRLAEEIEHLRAENERLQAQLDEARADLAWIHNAAGWLKDNLSNPRAWQCVQDIADRATPQEEA